MLIIQAPVNRQPERDYIFAVLLGEFLGLDFVIDYIETDCITVRCADASGCLVIADQFLQCNPQHWLKLESLPVQPLPLWHVESSMLSVKLVDRSLPVIYGDDPTQPNFFQRSAESMYLGLDVFGAAFFMLTRYEEVVRVDRDHLDRFPAQAAIAVQENFLDRPIVNEYLEILWACLKSLWPGLARSVRQYKMYVSHDVDEPFRFAFSGTKRLLQRCAGDIRYRKSPAAALKSVVSWSEVKLLGKADRDPANTFSQIMDLSERQNLQSAFYFITDHSAGDIDGVYHMDHPLIRNLLREIHDRGHEIGLHTSYNTYLNPEQTQKEFNILRQACEAEGIHQNTWGGRQHYLRWQTPTTFQNWDQAGLDYDSTLTYADRIGFRCGTCYEFPIFDILQGRSLRLRERPLAVMEVTVMRAAYMGLDIASGAAFQAIQTIKQRCQLFQGDFTMLWHNTGFIDPSELNLYQNLIKS
jgi:peptidoglycan/xylan/chitin deacetylase (PgdA/CDA1 family)